MKHEHVIGIDIGGTKFTLALADSKGRPLRHVPSRTRVEHGAQGIVDAILGAIPQLLRHSARHDAEVRRIGIGFGGPVNYDDGRILLSHHVPGWEGFPLKETLESKFEIPTVLDNDCNAAALGEMRFGAGRGHLHMLYVNLGTGIGGGIIVNGQIVRGVHNIAGEIGHMTIDPSGPVCTCGRRGCLEAFASGPSIAAIARVRQKDISMDSEQVFAAARRGERWAKVIVSETADRIARAVGGAVCLFNPSIVILGGGISEVGDLLIRPMRRAVPRYTLDLHRQGLKIVRAKLGYNAGVMGAVALALIPQRSNQS